MPDVVEYVRYPGICLISWNMPDILEYVRCSGHIGKYSARISGDNTQFQGMIYNISNDFNQCPLSMFEGIDNYYKLLAEVVMVL